MKISPANGAISAALHKKKSAVVLGLGISNVPLVRILLESGISVTACDKKAEENIPSANELKSLGATLVTGEDYLSALKEQNSVVFRSPGIRPDIPEITDAISNGCFLTSEMEWFFELCPAHVFGITGSDGKTTTTTLTAKLLEAETNKHGIGKVYIGGNIGAPLLPKVNEMTENDFAVVELSSFQLMTMKKCPERSIITNISPNHLNWHTDMQEYTDSKLAIFKGNGCKLLVTNLDCDITSKLSLEGGVNFCFSRKTVPSSDNCVYLKDGSVILRENGTESEIIKASDILIPGLHNVENYMAAIAITEGLVSKETVYELATAFTGVEHRCEFVREYNGVSYYNSSIDSTPSRTQAALSSFCNKVIVIICGRDKHLPLEPLADTLIDKAKAVILSGEAIDKVNDALKANPRFSEERLRVIAREEFTEAVIAARDAAESGDTVILSPAFTSFDRFNNFEERGRLFKSIVNSFN